MSKKFLSPIKLAQGATNPATGSTGELFYNTTDLKVYSHNGTTWLPSAGGFTISDTAPTSPTPRHGDSWLDSSDGSLYARYVDQDGTGQWIQIQTTSSINSELTTRMATAEANISTLQTNDAGKTSSISTLQSQVSTANSNITTLQGQVTSLQTYSVQSPNVIINGAFDIWQRGTSFSSSGYTADRWTGDFVTGSGTVSQQTFSPGAAPVAGYEGTFFLRRNVTTGAQFSSLIHRVEDVRTFAGQTVTLSFWAKGTNPTGNFVVNLLQTFGSGGSGDTSATALTSTSLVLTNLWTRYTYTFSVPSIAGKTIGTNSFLWLSIYQAAANTSASTLDIWGVQLEAGSVATPFRRNAPSIQAELAACQRYFVSVNSLSNGFRFYGSGSMYQPTLGLAIIALPVKMRISPVVTTSAANTFQILTGGSNITLSAIAGANGNQGEEAVALDITLGTTIANTSGFTFRSNGVTTSWIYASAEL